MEITLTLWHVLVVGVFNVGVLAFLVFDWFRKNYTIVDLETWNTVVEYYNENADKEDTDLASGCGFFREYLYDEEEGEEEGQPEEEENE